MQEGRAPDYYRRNTVFDLKLLKERDVEEGQPVLIIFYSLRHSRPEPGPGFCGIPVDLRDNPAGSHSAKIFNPNPQRIIRKFEIPCFTLDSGKISGFLGIISLGIFLSLYPINFKIVTKIFLKIILGESERPLVHEFILEN